MADRFVVLVFAVATTIVAGLAAWLPKDEAFPSAAERRVAGVVLALDAAFGWWWFGLHEEARSSPEWNLTLGMLVVAGVAAAAHAVVRGIGLHWAVRAGLAASCFFAPWVLWALSM